MQEVHEIIDYPCARKRNLQNESELERVMVYRLTAGTRMAKGSISAMTAAVEFRFLDPGLLSDGELALVLEQCVPANPVTGWSPTYAFTMRVRGQMAGHINLRIGQTRMLLLYAGHIGYSVEPGIPWPSLRGTCQPPAVPVGACAWLHRVMDHREPRQSTFSPYLRTPGCRHGGNCLAARGLRYVFAWRTLKMPVSRRGHPPLRIRGNQGCRPRAFRDFVPFIRESVAVIRCPRVSFSG